MKKIVKKIMNWRTLLGLFLITLSALLYFLHFSIFKDSHHIFIYLIGDIAFVPLEVLIVTLIIHTMLEKRAKRTLMQKMNMLIGAFFSEIGTELLGMFSGFDINVLQIRNKLCVDNEWSNKNFRKISKEIKTHAFDIDGRKGNIEELCLFLKGKRDFLVNLLSNPSLLEHDSFTKLLWGVFHLTEELMYRKQLEDLSEEDIKHISGDIKRAYALLVAEWVDYMRHLKTKYPYLFSLAMRTNPFDPQCKVEIG